MAPYSLDEDRHEKFIWIAIVLLPFVCLVLDFYSGTSRSAFAGFDDTTRLMLKVFYPPMLCLPSFVLACLLPMDEFAKLMLGFCLAVLSYLPIHYFTMFLLCLKAGTCL